MPWYASFALNDLTDWKIGMMAFDLKVSNLKNTLFFYSLPVMENRIRKLP